MLLSMMGLGATHAANAEESTCSGFGGHVSGTVTDKLIVDGSCLIDDAEVKGNVEVQGSSPLLITNSLVTGNIECHDHAEVILTNSTLKGNISGCDSKVRRIKASKGNKLSGTLSLFQKVLPGVNPGDDTQGRILPGGASAVMKYSLWGETFGYTLKAKYLWPQTSYTLVYYPDPWPGEGLICLSSGISSGSGKLAFANNVDLQTDLPAAIDANFAAVPPSGATGAKIWLVPSDKVDCVNRVMLGWNPVFSLFGQNLINFEYRPD
jgi:hypothetical protein